MPRSLDAHLVVVEAMYGRRQYQKCRKYINNKLLVLFPRCSRAYYFQAMCVQHDQSKKAAASSELLEEQVLGLLKRALQYSPDDALAQAAAKRARAIVAGRTTGNEHFKAGRFEEALGHYTNALAFDPCTGTVAKLQFNTALCLDKLGRAAAAIEACTAAIRADPRYTKALIKRAELYEAQRSIQEAINDLESLPNSDRHSVAHTLGRLHRLLRQQV